LPKTLNPKSFLPNSCQVACSNSLLTYHTCKLIGVVICVICFFDFERNLKFEFLGFKNKCDKTFFIVVLKMICEIHETSDFEDFPNKLEFDPV
jgi:hypothetical protein